jgi:hypothetical protein
MIAGSVSTVAFFSFCCWLSWLSMWKDRNVYIYDHDCMNWCSVLLCQLQAPVLIKYPASLSLTAYSYSFATLFMVLTGALATNGLHEWALTTTEIIAVLYAVSINWTLDLYFMTCMIMLRAWYFRNLPGYLTTFFDLYDNAESLIF